MPGLQIDNGNIRANIQFPGLPMRYTLDGSDPVATSPLYNQPINSKGIFRAAAFNDKAHRGIIAEMENR